MTDGPLIFGKHTVKDAEARRPPKSVNPCVDQFGAGPHGIMCQECSHLIGTADRTTSPKCRLRPRRSGSHSRFWPACAEFDQRYEPGK